MFSSHKLITIFPDCCYSSCPTYAYFFLQYLRVSLFIECVYELQGIVKGCTYVRLSIFKQDFWRRCVCSSKPWYANEKYNDKAVSFEEEVELHEKFTMKKIVFIDWAIFAFCTHKSARFDSLSLLPCYNKGNFSLFETSWKIQWFISDLAMIKSSHAQFEKRSPRTWK